MKKIKCIKGIFYLTVLLAFTFNAKAQYYAEPVIGLDSLNRLIMRQLKFPADFIKKANSAVISFSIEVDSTGRVNYLMLNNEDEDTSLNQLYRQFSAVILKLEWNRNIPACYVDFKITFPYEKPVYELESVEYNGPVGKDIVPEDVPYIMVREEAYFPGGNDNFKRFINEQMSYPGRCLEEGMEGTLIMQFAIDLDGRIRDITVLRDVNYCPEFAQEGIRILKMSPRWKPARENGKAFKSYHSVPIQFRIND